MSTITERLLARFERWLDHLVAPDTRYVCGGCDDRFPTRFAGVEHVLRCHPEYQGVVVYEGAAEPVIERPWRQAWTNRPSGAALWSPEDFQPVGAGAAMAGHVDI